MQLGNRFWQVKADDVKGTEVLPDEHFPQRTELDTFQSSPCLDHLLQASHVGQATSFVCIHKLNLELAEHGLTHRIHTSLYARDITVEIASSLMAVS